MARKKLITDDRYHDTLLLLKKYRDVTWSLTVAVEQAKSDFRDCYGGSIDEFLDSIYLAGADLGGTDIEERAKSIERSNKMLKLVDSAVNTMRIKHKTGDLYYHVLYFNFLSPNEYRTNEDIVNALETAGFPMCYRTMTTYRTLAVECVGSILYVRQGTSSVQASPNQIRQMMKESDGDVFEEMRTMYQELTFEAAENAFHRYHVNFSEDKYIHLGLRSLHDDQYTNLALLLSDQCKHTTKIAVFGDADNITFKDAKEFGGSIFKQLDDSYAYLTLCNRTTSTFKGLERLDRQDYPEEALREALLNALVHRDYSYSGSIIINVNDEKMEFISIGGLLPGLSPEDIQSGISQPRNRKLAEIFHRLRLIESYGTGIRKIFSLYKNCSVQPKIEVTPNSFKLILPNMNNEAKEPASPMPMTEKFTVTPQMKTVLDYIAEYGEIGDEELQELLGIKKTRAYLLTRQMAEHGVIQIVGRGATKRYRTEKCGVVAMKRAGRIAEENGPADMTLDEINEEISATRDVEASID